VPGVVQGEAQPAAASCIRIDWREDLSVA
jgi:hypothetical protein